MARLSPLVTLILGYILGYVLYPVLQVWTCNCEQSDVPAHAQSSLVAKRAAFVRSDINPSPEHYAQKSVNYASWRQFFNAKVLRRNPPAHLSSEYKIRGRIYIGVITAEKYLKTRAKAIHETWAREVDPSTKVMFYVGSDCNISHPGLGKMSIIRLENVLDAVYPPQRKVFAALQHMYRYHGNSYQWFVRADDDVYIRVPRLDRLLGRLDSNDKVYLGRAGVGRKQDTKRLQLKSDERYCMGGPGVVLSRATLNAVAPHLERCLKAVEAHNRVREGVTGAWFNEDVELGRCISRTVGVQCSNSKEVRIAFLCGLRISKTTSLLMTSSIHVNCLLTSLVSTYNRCTLLTDIQYPIEQINEHTFTLSLFSCYNMFR